MITNHLTEYLDLLAQTKADSTVKNAKSTLTKFIAFTGVEDASEILARDVMRFKQNLLAGGTVNSSNIQLQRVKRFLNYLVDKNVLLDSPAEDIMPTAVADLPPKWLTEDQRDKLIRAVKRDGIGAQVAESKRSFRNYAIVLMMLQTGIRVRELANLKWDDVELGERKGRLMIRGKNGQQRTLTITSDLLSVLKQYSYVDGYRGEFVFYSRKSNQIGVRTVQTMVESYSKTVDTNLTAHMLRHTFAHDLISGGMQLEAVARLMGHIKKDGSPNIQQTIRYTKASQEEIDEDMERILATR